MIDYHCPHQWVQTTPFIPAWVQEMPKTPICPPTVPPISPNPFIPSTATMPICLPLEMKKTGPQSVLITVSIPTESIFTLPTKALEIKTIKKHLKLTQCRFFNSPPPVCGIPQDTPKLFLGGFVRKDVQYSEPIRQTATTVEGSIKDFVIDLPYSCVVDLNGIRAIAPTLFSRQAEYEYALKSGDLSEYNLISREFLNKAPSHDLIFSQIHEMDNTLDRVPMPGGPFEEGLFKTVQEKMIILLQLELTFPVNNITQQTSNPQNHDHHHKELHRHHSFFSLTVKLLKALIKIEI
ncbi:hypothetical protein ACPUYX_15160 [Desulfosporosinus sp. SYSU MS00001]|uniref:hypothetical protein n=1 Tax=Desulfosporosinus sp. SYSU MS00001 TaxID=3416284 RepID=UPI003CFB4F8A